jgi:hypothetical protein
MQPHAEVDIVLTREDGCLVCAHVSSFDPPDAAGWVSSLMASAESIQ